MAIHHADAVAVSADFGGQRSDAIAGEIAEDLLRLRLHLFFFAADEGDDVAHDVHGGDTGVPGAGDGLHGGDDHLGDAELFERAERHHQADGGAIRIGDDLALPAAGALLAGDQPEVVGIDFRNEQRYIELHAMVARVRDHDVSGLGEGALDFGGDAGIHGGEEQARRVAGFAFIDGLFGDGVGRAAGKVPRHGVLVLLAGGAIAGSEPHQVEPRVPLQELDEMLAHHAGGAENAYFDSRLHNSFTMRWYSSTASMSWALGTRSSSVCAT